MVKADYRTEGQEGQENRCENIFEKRRERVVGEGYSRVGEDFEVGRRAWNLPHSHRDVVGQFSGHPQGVGELLGVR